MEQTVETVKLGKKYRDKLHKIKGVATALCEYLTGCDYVCLEYLKDDGSEVKELWIDVVRLEEIGPAVPRKEPAERPYGGPHDAPSHSKPGGPSIPSR